MQETAAGCSINVLIPSRGRPTQLAAALTSLNMCLSGENNVWFCVACDDDDTDTQQLLRRMRADMPLNIRIGPRPESLGSVANDLAAHWPADAYAVFGDDLLCVSYGWDALVAKAVRETPHGVFWWTSSSGVETYVPIITEKWRAAAGFIFTEHFPFWFDDLWLQELWIMATQTPPQVLPIKLVDKPQATIRMRELRFWQDFYARMRGERVRHGRQIAAALGIPEPVIGPMLAERLNALTVSDEFLADIERRNHADTGEPSEMYLRTRARAEELMRHAA